MNDHAFTVIVLLAALGVLLCVSSRPVTKNKNQKEKHEHK